MRRHQNRARIYQRAGAERGEGGIFTEKAYRVWKLVAAIIIVGNSACCGGNWIIDADGGGGLGNRETNGRRPAEQKC